MKKVFLLLVFPVFLFAESYIGSFRGFFQYNGKRFIPLWTNGGVFEILPYHDALVLRTSHGIFLYHPLSQEIQPRNSGLKSWLLQEVENGMASWQEDREPLMDIAIAPDNPEVWVACSKSMVYLSTNAGRAWVSLGSPTFRGWLSVAVQATPILTVWAGHALNGIFRYQKSWKRESAGLFSDILYNEEISSLEVVSTGHLKGVWAVNNFFPFLYRWETNRWKQRAALSSDSGYAAGLSFNQNILSLTTDHGIYQYDGENLSPSPLPEEVQAICSNFLLYAGTPVQALIKDGKVFSELWAYQNTILNERQQKANKKYALYLSPLVLAKPGRFYTLTNLIKAKGINAFVIDIKDDWGNLRFSPQTPLLQQTASVRPLPLSNILRYAKNNNIYLIARIVLFQDRRVYSLSNYAFAVWDGEKNKPWQGIKKEKETIKEIQEYWVDSYHPFVWEYNLAIAREAIRLGFDEIQFDYVRFPTDGENLKSVFYRAKKTGMTPESLLYSFLRHMRKNLSVPISMDIYGANGWYRTSLRTYQEIDLLSEFIDVFCPMYYPSHFDQKFLAHPPAEERPYRIYFYGTKRNFWLTRGRSLIRPYVQAFKIGVSYDRAYYGESYVQKEIKGVHHAHGSGFTFWNMEGNYRILTNLNLRP
ncbi:putative glycoside hydrolase [Thermospira aquatica]|uniref:DUF4015 domain-containing protein n=1 Tax=Thermospira aquatica TaxID=2828656 RepID=A0AAX3BF71_9SPIR|nr:putative glycoside hydrolase [Thermospira aquatica]URA11022.1 hypothetical protein KDW03_04255 [Thermospira aquatica]